MRYTTVQWLAEELWQRLLRPATTSGNVGLKLLADEAQKMARSQLTFSALHACLTPAHRSLHCKLEGHKSSVNALTTYDANGHTWVATCSDDKTVRIWKPMDSCQEVSVFKDHSGNVHGVTAFNSEGPKLATCSENTIRIWDATSLCQGPLTYDKHHEACVKGVTAFKDKDGNLRLASCSLDMTVRIWDAMNCDEPIYVLKGHQAAVNGVTAFVANNGTWVASCSTDKTVRIWDPTREGEAVHVLAGHSGGVNGVTTFADADGTWVASGSDDRTVRIWDAINGSQAKHVLEGLSAPINGVTCVDARGSSTLVASCSNDSTVRIWNAIKGGKAFFVIPMDSPPTAISTVSAARTRYARSVTILLAAGHKIGQVTFWEYMQPGSSERSCCT